MIFINLISVIVPVYNVEKYLPQCLDSVVNQSCKNIEIILVNDGSSDTSGAICDTYAKKDKRILVIHQENKGVSEARNAGLNLAHGEYVYFVDSDDWIALDTLETLLFIIQNHDSDMVVGSLQQNSKDGKPTDPPSLLPDLILSQSQMIAFLHDKLHFRVVWNKLYKRFLWDNLRFPVGRLHEDESTVHHTLFDCKQVYTTSHLGYFYRDTPNSIMHTYSIPKEIDRLDALEDRIQTLIKAGYDSTVYLFESDWWHYFFVLYPEIQKKHSSYQIEANKLYEQFSSKYVSLRKKAKTIDKVVLWMFRFLPSVSCSLIRAKRKLVK